MMNVCRMLQAGGGVLAVALLTAVPGAAQEPASARQVEQLQRQVEQLRREVALQDTAQVAELRRQIELLTRDLEEMRLGREVAVAADTSMYGLAPAASKVYRSAPGLSIGGYGEVLYENFAQERENGAASGAVDQLDALRAILYVGYKFNDRLLFNSELEWEHGTTGTAGEASIEFAYVDYILTPAFGLRAGILLAPIGLINELHESPIFLGTTRPLTEQVIIPTTWREGGFGAFGQIGPVAYRAYLMNSLDGVGGGASKAGGFGASGLRGGRQKAAKALAEDWGAVARVDYVGYPGLVVGGSVYQGETAQNRVLPGTAEEVDGRVRIWETHVEYKAYGLDLRGLYARANLNDVAALNRLRGLTGAGSIGEEMNGGYVQAGYDVLRFTDVRDQLVPYFRYERVNTQSSVPTGFSANPATDRGALLLGTMWKPIPQISVKADYQILTNEAETGVNQFNVNLGYLF